MAGHQKWSKVKPIKARVDAIKGRVSSKCAHEFALAARAGGGNFGGNARLRNAIGNAMAVSMLKDNAERAIRKAPRDLGCEMLQENSHEGDATDGFAFVVEMATHDLNRSAAGIRSVFSTLRPAPRMSLPISKTPKRCSNNSNPKSAPAAPNPFSNVFG